MEVERDAELAVLAAFESDLKVLGETPSRKDGGETG